MKKVLLSLLVIAVALGLLGAAGYAGYRYGFIQGMSVASNNTNGNSQSVGPGFRMNPRGMPMHNNSGFTHDFDGDGLRRLERGGFGLFPVFGGLAQLLFWGLIVAGIVWLVTRSGWHITRSAPVAAAPVPPAPVVETTPPPSSDSPEENQGR